jgi:hypothetical protein
MSPSKSQQPKSRRQLGKPQSPRDLIAAFGLYYDRVERDQSGNLSVTCTRCKITAVIVWETDERYVLGCLEFAHQYHNHRGG